MHKRTCSITAAFEPFPPPNRSEARLRAALDDVLTALAEREAVTHFLTGLFPGGDLIAAEQTLALAGRRPGLTLECVLPFEAQAAHWPEPLRDRYFAAAARCARETLLQRHETPDSRARTAAVLPAAPTFCLPSGMARPAPSATPSAAPVPAAFPSGCCTRIPGPFGACHSPRALPPVG